MPRYRLTIEYAGAGYVGWQRQDNAESIQGTIEAAFKRFCGEDVIVYGSGRTDAGVHAIGQVAHVDVERDWHIDKVRDAVNAHLQAMRARIVILEVAVAAPDFDARFSALRRHYLYRILTRWTPLVLERERAWWVKRPLDAAIMHEAAQRLVGHHDFSTFRSTNCQAKSPIKTLDRLDVSVCDHDGAIEIRASARSFLHNQIRSFAGTLKMVGDGKWTPDDVADALESRDRKRCGPVAPPQGLYFVSVDY